MQCLNKIPFEIKVQKKEKYIQILLISVGEKLHLKAYSITKFIIEIRFYHNFK